MIPLTARTLLPDWFFRHASSHAGTQAFDRYLEHVMRTISTGVLLIASLVACAGNRADEVSETTREGTDTVVTSKRVVDTLLVNSDTTIATDTTIAADTTIVADTTIAADTAVAADTTIAADTTKLGDEGVISVDTTTAR